MGERIELGVLGDDATCALCAKRRVRLVAQRVARADLVMAGAGPGHAAAVADRLAGLRGSPRRRVMA
jgi:hypothetical protein